MVSHKERMPALCSICRYCQEFHCDMQDIDVREESWLKQFNGCNQFKES